MKTRPLACLEPAATVPKVAPSKRGAIYTCYSFNENVISYGKEQHRQANISDGVVNSICVELLNSAWEHKCHHRQCAST